MGRVLKLCLKGKSCPYLYLQSPGKADLPNLITAGSWVI